MISRRLAAALVALASLPALSRAERLPVIAPPPESPVRITFQVLPPGEKDEVSKAISQMESVRLLAESLRSGQESLWKVSSSLSLAGGTRHERVALLIEEGGAVRQLGTRSIMRQGESPTAETKVFESGKPNPLSEGTRISVAEDTYDLLGLGFALRAIVAHPKPVEVHVWNGGTTASAAKVELDGEEEIFLLGQNRKTKRFRVTAEAAKTPLARFWYSADAPHGLLQIAGRPEFLSVAGAAPDVLLRASSSSDHSLLGSN